MSFDAFRDGSSLGMCNGSDDRVHELTLSKGRDNTVETGNHVLIYLGLAIVYLERADHGQSWGNRKKDLCIPQTDNARLPPDRRSDATSTL